MPLPARSLEVSVQVMISDRVPNDVLASFLNPHAMAARDAPVDFYPVGHPSPGGGEITVPMRMYVRKPAVYNPGTLPEAISEAARLFAEQYPALTDHLEGLTITVA